MCWVFPWWTCPGEARLFRSWCVCAGPRGGEASSSSSLLWILSKPKDCSKSLDWLEYSLVGRPWAAHRTTACTWQSPLLPSFGWSFSYCLSRPDCAFRFVALIQVFIWPAVVSLPGRNNYFVHLQSPDMKSRAGGPFSCLTYAYFCWAHLLHGERWSTLISAVFWGSFACLIALWHKLDYKSHCNAWGLTRGNLLEAYFP